MKVAFVAAVSILMVASIHGAAVPSIENPSADANTNVIEGSDRAGKMLSSRTMNPIALPFHSLNRLSNPLKFDKFHLENVKNFALTHKDAIIWGAVGIVGLVALVLVVSLFTGFDVIAKSFVTGFDKVRGRADDMGLKLDAEHLNLLTSRVFEAIDSWGQQQNLKTE